MNKAEPKTKAANQNRAAADLKAMLTHSRRVVFFTGAGISTESGIPDFRSPGGVWDKFKPIEYGDFIASAEMRREAWRRKFETDKVISVAKPNRGHRAVAHLIREGRASAVITQNIDGLHQASGVPDARVIELHGNGTYATCLSCAMRYELIDIRGAFEADGQAPVCGCGGLIKTATISFGQAMPEDAMAAAERESLACDLFIAMGSSLVVYPAAGFPRLAKQNGARLVIINREPTDQDSLADLVIHAGIGETLGAAVGVT